MVAVNYTRYGGNGNTGQPGHIIDRTHRVVPLLVLQLGKEGEKLLKVIINHIELKFNKRLRK